ncbi:MAG TPA: urate hydroxylase PuuD [Burkholderiaceae bacterium]|nr:urate hydroxylase PuuD [Burkholderiaceae bacterium]
MGAILQSLGRTVAAGVVLLVIIIILAGVLSGQFIAFNQAYLQFFMRWLHVLSGVMWIGLLWYFNFVQTPSMPKIPDEQKPAISKVISPAALFWFRWAALATVITGLLLAGLNGYLIAALTFSPGVRTIGLGMWLALIMAYNVWFIIWPNQKKALGIVQVAADEKAKAARVAMLTSRINTLLSIAMLYCMVGQSHGGF